MYHDLNLISFFALIYRFPTISFYFLGNVLILIQWHFYLNRLVSFLISLDQLSCSSLFFIRALLITDLAI